MQLAGYINNGVLFIYRLFPSLLLRWRFSLPPTHSIATSFHLCPIKTKRFSQPLSWSRLHLFLTLLFKSSTASLSDCPILQYISLFLVESRKKNTFYKSKWALHWTNPQQHFVWLSHPQEDVWCVCPILPLPSSSSTLPRLCHNYLHQQRWSAHLNHQTKAFCSRHCPWKSTTRQRRRITAEFTEITS